MIRNNKDFSNNKLFKRYKLLKKDLKREKKRYNKKNKVDYYLI